MATINNEVNRFICIYLTSYYFCLIIIRNQTCTSLLRNNKELEKRCRSVNIAVSECRNKIATKQITLCIKLHVVAQQRNSGGHKQLHALYNLYGLLGIRADSEKGGTGFNIVRNYSFDNRVRLKVSVCRKATSVFRNIHTNKIHFYF